MQQKTKSAVQKIENRLSDKGVRFTPPRRLVLGALLESAQPMTAYEVVDSLDDVKPMTVYRALDFLSAEGLAHRIESKNAYVACAEDHCAHKDSQFLICDSCGTTEELHSHAIDDFIKDKLKKSGFTLSHKVMELHGRCSQCA